MPARAGFRSSVLKTGMSRASGSQIRAHPPAIRARLRLRVAVHGRASIVRSQSHAQSPHRSALFISVYSFAVTCCCDMRIQNCFHTSLSLSLSPTSVLAILFGLLPPL